MKKTIDTLILSLVIAIGFSSVACDGTTPPPDKYADVIGHGCTEALFVRQWDATTGTLIHDGTLPATTSWSDADGLGYGPCSVTVDGTTYVRKTQTITKTDGSYITISVPDPVCDTLQGFVCDNTLPETPLPECYASATCAQNK